MAEFDYTRLVVVLAAMEREIHSAKRAAEAAAEGADEEKNRARLTESLKEIRNALDRLPSQ